MDSEKRKPVYANCYPDCKSEITPEIVEGMCPQCRELPELVENWHLLAPTARKRILTAVVGPRWMRRVRSSPTGGWGRGGIEPAS